MKRVFMSSLAALVLSAMAAGNADAASWKHRAKGHHYAKAWGWDGWGHRHAWGYELGWRHWGHDWCGHGYSDSHVNGWWVL